MAGALAETSMPADCELADAEESVKTMPYAVKTAKTSSSIIISRTLLFPKRFESEQSISFI